jgi:hypothetical protein
VRSLALILANPVSLSPDPLAPAPLRRNNFLSAHHPCLGLATQNFVLCAWSNVRTMGEDLERLKPRDRSVRCWFRLIGEMRGQNFDGNDAVQTGIAGLAHFAHPARTNTIEDFVRAQTFAREAWPRAPANLESAQCTPWDTYRIVHSWGELEAPRRRFHSARASSN